MKNYLAAVLFLCCVSIPVFAQKNARPYISGIYPHLAMWNGGNECGTGAVVPWAGSLWAITYAPHFPHGSDDKLYEIKPNLEISAFEGSVGGTPANRMIHRETNQLIIGPYVIDGEGNVRVIPPDVMPGRLTGNARHLFEPERKVYYATMEEGFYEVDMVTLEVKEWFRDTHIDIEADFDLAHPGPAWFAGLPGYHGKGMYSGQGRVIYANNGENSSEARQRPDVPSGSLAEWDGESRTWTVVRRNQFTDVRGPGGLYGNTNPETDPVWSIGWDHRSLILMALDQGEWHAYRLPKASHCYDGAHGWNTEWPRIHDIGEDDMAMNMHGMFWRFPRGFSPDNSSGIAPRSTYLKVLGDYTRWGGWLVFGCDDSAKSEFLNTRKAKGSIAGPGQSHSNLWFARPSILDEMGASLGRGLVWSNEDVSKDRLSDPYLFAGFERRSVFLEHDSDHSVEFVFEIDEEGNNQWREWMNVTVPAQSSKWLAFDTNDPGVWIRLSAKRDCQGASAAFFYSNEDERSTQSNRIFAGLAEPEDDQLAGGLVRVRGDGLKTMALAVYRSVNGATSEPAFYELDETLSLTRVDDPAALQWTIDNLAIPENVLAYDEASVIYVDDNGARWRLPRGRAGYDGSSPYGLERISREVVTERDLFNCAGIFYELPARNAGGFAKIRPISTHNLHINDYCSYRGMLILTGVYLGSPYDNRHIIYSDDGNVAIWAGVVDDLWKMGKAVGIGGPWLNSEVTAGQASDPYLMTGFDQKSVSISHQSSEPFAITLQVDIDGSGTWVDYKTFMVEPEKTLVHEFHEAFAAYWVRAISERDAVISVQFEYE